MDTGYVTFYKNGVSQGVANTSSLLGRTITPCLGNGGVDVVDVVNFGQRAFAYTAPSGFKALCTTNLPDPTIADGSTAMDVVTYTGNGTSQTISGFNFSPDFIWIKNRASATSHLLFDRDRGATKYLSSNTAGGEGNDPNSLTAFTSDGFSVGTTNAVNQSTSGIVTWAWDAGSSSVTNTDGTITSQVRANPSVGFSVVTYTGTGSASYVGHGLNAAPIFMMTKQRNATRDWFVQTTAIDGSADYLLLNLTDSKYNTVFSWSSTTFTVGGGPYDNASGGTYVTYCWTPVEGYSAFGSYTGNGSFDGPFVYTGFRPRWILKKRTDAVDYWYIWDTARDPDNVVEAKLEANDQSTEYTSVDWLDITSNGFKIRYNGGDVNASGGTYLYAAFAENPFKTARAR
jgi:hypothetical protein